MQLNHKQVNSTRPETRRLRQACRRSVTKRLWQTAYQMHCCGMSWSVVTCLRQTVVSNVAKWYDRTASMSLGTDLLQTVGTEQQQCCCEQTGSKLWWKGRNSTANNRLISQAFWFYAPSRVFYIFSHELQTTFVGLVVFVWYLQFTFWSGNPTGFFFISYRIYTKESCYGYITELCYIICLLFCVDVFFFVYRKVYILYTAHWTMMIKLTNCSTVAQIDGTTTKKESVKQISIVRKVVLIY